MSVAVYPSFIGNEASVELLRASLRRGRVAHAYLFTGPPRVGKTTLALWLARALLCTNRNPDSMEPCGECSTCRRIERGTHPDVALHGLEAGAREVGIDTIRELTAEIGLLPFEAQRRVFVLTDAQAMTIEAANSLLKTLEEPPAPATLVLAAVDDATLPDTIRSRCTVLRLHPVLSSLIAVELERRGAGPESAARIASLAFGRPGWAIEALEDGSRVEAVDANIASLLEALGSGAQGRLKLAERLGKQWSDDKRTAVYETLLDWLGYWREVLAVAVGQPASAAYTPFASSIAAFARNGTEAAAASQSATVQAITRLDANVNARMALETLLLELPSWRSS